MIILHISRFVISHYPPSLPPPHSPTQRFFFSPHSTFQNPANSARACSTTTHSLLFLLLPPCHLEALKKIPSGIDERKWRNSSRPTNAYEWLFCRFFSFLLSVWGEPPCTRSRAHATPFLVNAKAWSRSDGLQGDREKERDFALS